jgi:cyanophycinase-like exopeptidase
MTTSNTPFTPQPLTTPGTPSTLPRRRRSPAPPATQPAADIAPLPEHPRLEQYRKQAKDLVKAHRAGDMAAAERVARFLPRLAPAESAVAETTRLRLSDVQLVLAREHGFQSWPRFKAHLERVESTEAVVVSRERAAASLSDSLSTPLESGDGPGLGLEVQEIVGLAEEEARRRGHTRVLPKHLAYGLTRHPGGQAAVANAGIDPLWWRDYICFVEGVNAVGQGAREARHHVPWAPLTAAAPLRWDPVVRRVLEWASAEAHGAGRSAAVPADLLTALKLEGTYEPAGTLERLGVSVAQTRTAAGHRYPGGRPRPPVRSAVRPASGRGGALILLGKAFDSGTGSAPSLWAWRVLELVLSSGRRCPGTPLKVVTLQAARPAPVERVVARSQRYFDELDEGVEVEALDSGLAEAADARSSEVVARLAGADVVLLEGGRPERLYDATIGSPALEALAAASGRGAVLVGGSAGAMIFGAGATSDWYTGDPARLEPVRFWGWLDRVVVRPHFGGDSGAPPGASDSGLRDALRAFPGHIGLGIADAGAALVLPGWREVEALGAPLRVITAPDAPGVEVEIGGSYLFP